MLYINLDSEFNPFNASPSNVIPCETSRSDTAIGEINFKLKSKNVKFALTSLTSLQCVITHRIADFNDLGILIKAVKTLKENYCTRIGLFLGFFPGSTEDLKTFSSYCQIINSLDLQFVEVFDCNNPLALGLLNNSQNITNFKFVYESLKELKLSKGVVLESNNDNYNKLFTFLNRRKIEVSPSFYRKIFNSNTENLKEIVLSEDLKGKDCILIENNLLGKGFELKMLIDELRSNSVNSITLISSHPLFPNNIKKLIEDLDLVITTNSCRVPTISKIRYYNLNENLISYGK